VPVKARSESHACVANNHMDGKRVKEKCETYLHFFVGDAGGFTEADDEWWGEGA